MTPSRSLTAQSAGAARGSGESPGRVFLQRYFFSGWAFLIPYLAAFLLYHWKGWPINASVSAVPSLIAIYCGLHVAHALLALVAIGVRPFGRPGWSGRAGELGRAAGTFLPWTLLGLVFFVPGAYLEFPSDPWTHLARINRWATQTSVVDLYKNSSYFLAYSLLGRIPANRQAIGLDLYYTGASLLVCWQYFRLALAVGLGRRAALIFVIVQSLLLGNSTFSFYRYYGLASTMIAQLGAIAVMRICLEAGPGRRRIGAAAAAILLLLVLIALNHVEGLLLAGLGIAAVGSWRLVGGRPSRAWLLGGAALALSLAAYFYWPRTAAVEAIYRPAGVLSRWYGFDVLSPRTLAGSRLLEILGVIGAANLVAGAVLLTRNHVVGWLTVMPVFAACLPCVALPFADLLARHGGPGDVIVFHRMFFAIPPGLALSVGAAALWRHPSALPRRFSSFALLLAGLLGLVAVPAGAPCYNRFWNAVMTPADDLGMKAVWNDIHANRISGILSSDSILIDNPWISFIADAQRETRVLRAGRTSHNDNIVPANQLDFIRYRLGEKSGEPAARRMITVVSPQPPLFYTAASQAALLSAHWLPQEAALSAAGSRELDAMCASAGLLSSTLADGTKVYRGEER